MEITHPNKILFPEENITKQILADFYEKFSDYILPYIINRPLVLFRCTKSYEKGCFVHKHLAMSSKSVYTVSIPENQSKKPYVYIQNVEGLLELIQMNTVEIHTWGCHVKKIEKPDLMIFDLDPAPNVPWKEVIHLAYSIKEELDNIGLKSFIKTSGGKGLHIAVPIKPSVSWEEMKIFSSTFSKFIEAKNPGKYITTMSKAKRSGKIFIDYFRNNRGSTTVAAYSVRAKPHAPISTPLSWAELSSHISASHYTLNNLAHRLSRLKRDPWEGFYDLQQTLPYVKNRQLTV